MPRKSRVPDHQKHDFFHLMKKYNYKTTKDMVLYRTYLIFIWKENPREACSFNKNELHLRWSLQICCFNSRLSENFYSNTKFCRFVPGNTRRVHWYRRCLRGRCKMNECLYFLAQNKETLSFWFINLLLIHFPYFSFFQPF